MVVDDQHAQLASARRPASSARSRASRLHSTERHDEAYLPAVLAARTELKQSAGLQRLEPGEAQTHAGDPGPGRQRRCSSPRARMRRRAVRCERRRASDAHACGRCGSPRRAPIAPAAPAPAARRRSVHPATSPSSAGASISIPRSGCSWRSRATSSRKRRLGRLRRASEWPLHRAAQLAQRVLDLIRAARARLRVRAPDHPTARATPRKGAAPRSRAPRARDRSALRAAAARSYCRVAARAIDASAAILPRIQSTSRSPSLSDASSARRDRRGSRPSSARAPTSACRRPCARPAARHSRPGSCAVEVTARSRVPGPPPARGARAPPIRR